MTFRSDQIPIVLVASGTATAASAVYRGIEAEMRHRFPGHPIRWAFSSRVVRRKLRDLGDAPSTPEAVFDELHRQGFPRAIVQSLHLICGVEFHHLVRAGARSPLPIHLGLPLLAAPEDFEDILEWVASLRPQATGEALVMVGHGTDHPAWTAYALLAMKMEQRFGETVFLGQVKGEPSPASLADRLAAAGCRRVHLRPFMLVAGAHFMKDIAGPQTASWQSQLASRGLEVAAVGEGLGVDPIPMAVFGRHIERAMTGPSLKME